MQAGVGEEDATSQKNTHTHNKTRCARSPRLTQRAPPSVVGTREGAGIGGAVGAVAEKDAIAAGALGLVASRPASERVDRRIFAHPHARSVSKKLSLAASSLPPPPPFRNGVVVVVEEGQRRQKFICIRCAALCCTFANVCVPYFSPSRGARSAMQFWWVGGRGGGTIVTGRV